MRSGLFLATMLAASRLAAAETPLTFLTLPKINWNSIFVSAAHVPCSNSVRVAVDSFF
jgi:hypothetical protein